MYLKSSDISKLFFKVLPNSMSMVRCHIKRASEPSFLSFSKFRVLANIERGINTAGELADLHGVSQPAISKLVDSLVNEGFLTRHSNGSDRRVVELQITASGKRAIKKIKTQASKTFEPYMHLLNKSEQNELIDALRCLESFFVKVQEERS